jgi:Potential Queuosine, Q, salvage protein family
MGPLEGVRRQCARIAAGARHVRIDLDRLDAVHPGAPPELDPDHHFLEGSPEDVAMYVLTLDSINFGSGWFPTLRKRPGCSGYETVASSLSERFREHGPWPAADLRRLEAPEIARVLGQDPGHELMTLYAHALRDLGDFMGERSALAVVAAAEGSAERLAGQLAAGMPFFDDRGFLKRAQILPNDLALAGVAELHDLGRLTIFADNVVPHVLRVDGVLRYDAALAAHIDSEELLEPGEREREIRACAVHAGELIAGRLGVEPRVLDTWLWDRGREQRYRAVPRHRTRTVFY